MELPISNCRLPVAKAFGREFKLAIGNRQSAI